MNFLAVLDFDGTSDDRADVPGVHPEVRAVLARAMRRGWRWVLNSDRSRDDLLRVVQKLPRELRPAALVAQRRVIELADEQGNYRSHVVWNQDRAAAHRALWQRLPPHLDEWMEEIRATFRVRLDLSTRNAFGFVVHPEDVPALRAQLEKFVEGIQDAAVSSNHESCFVVHRESCKGMACREVARVLGVERAHVGAIGDAANDLPMLQLDTSGAAGCPGNACIEVQCHIRSRRGGRVARSDGAIGTAEVLKAWLSIWSDIGHFSLREARSGAKMSDQRPQLLIHGYGLLDAKRDLVAGSRMSGLTLYNTLLVEGLASSYQLTFLCGCLKAVDLFPRLLRPGTSVVEYDARFPRYLERGGQFVPRLANALYQDRVAEPDNPIYTSLARTYARVVSASRPEVINTHNPNAVCAALHAVLRGFELPPLLATIHDVNSAQIPFISRHQDRIVGFVAISRAVEAELTASGIASDRIHTIPNGLDLQPFLEVGHLQWQDVAKSHRLPQEPAFTVFVPARRVRGKGIDLALRAFDQVARHRREPMRLLVSGAGLADPGYEVELRELAASLKVQDRIYFLDEVTYEELPALFRVCDVSLLPSTRREGFGYSNIEAMATAGPLVVTTAHGGPLEYLVDGHNGFLVPPGDVTAIAEVIERVLNTPGEYVAMRREARATALRYTTDEMVASYDACIKSLLPLRPS